MIYGYNTVQYYDIQHMEIYFSPSGEPFTVVSVEED